MGSKQISSLIGFPDSLRKIREYKGYTQKEFAEAIGVPASTYSNYENGNRSPNIETFKKIAQTLGVPQSVLLISDAADRYIQERNENLVNLAEGFVTLGNSDIEQKVLEALNELNEDGQLVALSRIIELGKIPDYQAKD